MCACGGNEREMEVGDQGGLWVVGSKRGGNGGAFWSLGWCGWWLN